MSKLSLRDLPLAGKKVLMRVDFNVPLTEKGEIADDTRIRESLPSIQYVLNHNGELILMSHLGRPKGKPNAKLSLRPCAEHLTKLLGRPVAFAPDCIGPAAEEAAGQLKKGEVLLLENLRFHAAEEDPASDPSFAKSLAKLADYYVNDAFATAHRAHSSTALITSYFPNRAAAGFLMEKEIAFLTPLFSAPKHPFNALIGGAKISTKIGVLKSLLEKVDAFFIGGAMASTFLKAQGISIGSSLCEETELETAKQFLDSCAARKTPLHLPKDFLIAKEFSNEAERKTVLTTSGIPSGWRAMDIGPETIQEWKAAIQNSATIFWNGPLGVFEFSHFAKGTEEIARAIAALKTTSIVGGGDSVAAINKMQLAPHFSHLSTGGGASLEFLEFGHLPGIDALSPMEN